MIKIKQSTSILLVLITICSTLCLKAENNSKNELIKKDLKLFTTPLATELKENVTKAETEKINNTQLRSAASAMLNNSYKTEYRIESYKPYLDPAELGRELRIGDGYSKYENMTGIYLSKGKHLILADNIPENEKVEVWIPHWERRAPEGINPTEDPNGWGIHKKSFPITNGINIITLEEWDGLAYIYYFSDDPESLNNIDIHFVDGEINGYFDIKEHNNNDWDKLLKNAVYPVLDARGEHIQIAYPVEALKKYAPTRGTDLINNYDSLVYRQHRFMGWEKYNHVPENRILARVNYNYYMFRDSDGVAYNGTQPGYAMAMVADPDRVITGDPCWGFSHEVGHVHQLNPYLHWGGLGEVSNNINTLYVTTSFGNTSRLSNQNSYKEARKSIGKNNISYLQDPDVFNRLVPFWQLHLYFSQNGYPDFYADLHEVFRNQPVPKGDPRGRNSDKLAEYQLNFVKQVCKVSQTDLTEFFDYWGFFYVGEFEVSDYGTYQYTMTQEMVDNCKAEIKKMNLPKPKKDLTMLED
ncbi:M60 family metallopeptidase [Marinilabiliaceae bacterium ANBcel2]|nr:M60 family metallopeptidase [Marinilabiliaceae bacterium ANBcel2]